MWRWIIYQTFPLEIMQIFHHNSVLQGNILNLNDGLKAAFHLTHPAVKHESTNAPHVSNEGNVKVIWLLKLCVHVPAGARQTSRWATPRSTAWTRPAAGNPGKQRSRLYSTMDSRTISAVNAQQKTGFCSEERCTIDHNVRRPNASSHMYCISMRGEPYCPKVFK